MNALSVSTCVELVYENSKYKLEVLESIKVKR